jgi:serine/threonine protein kinase/tetratricopeptide (TPR) repeat protein
MIPDLDRTRTSAPAVPLDSALDAGLAAAFGGERSAGEWSRPPLLRDDPSDNAPLVRPDSPDMPKTHAGRYQLLGEIARGGMGVILKGRDPALGRDLAVKVLKVELAGKSAAEERFVEEAQVCGQLQHPGVVPVYELGRFSNGQPFFTMKLVKGRTLAALLSERDDHAQDRGRYLKIFEQVCQTMAYAHSRGVIHRDLKPANIMVGSFGEVQVMDWGLAKVIPQGGVADELKASHVARPREVPIEFDPTVIRTARVGSLGSYTEAGSVMGTPAFMPPEQAGGEIDKLDERADVFGLGAILCVILTGQPPYVADDSDAVRLMAIRGKLDDAFARLAACGADAELVGLTKRCLTPERDDRPRHAGEVAETVTAHLADVEQRAHQAEVDRAAADARTTEEVNTRREAEARAASERKRRKVQAVAGSLVTLVVLAGGAIASWQWQRADREEKRTRAALDQVTAEQEKTAAALAKLTEEQARTFAALNAMTDEGIERLFQSQLEMGEEQKAFVQKVIALYDQATQSTLYTPEGREQRADGYFRVGRLRTQLDDYPGAIESYQAAIGLLTPLSQEFPDERSYRFRLGVCRSYLTRAYGMMKRGREDAEAESRAALDLLTPLVAADAGNAEYQLHLARAHVYRGEALGNLDRFREGAAQLRTGAQLLRELYDRDPGNREYARSLAIAVVNLSFNTRDDRVERDRAHREAVAVTDLVRKRHPGVVDIERACATSHGNLGVEFTKQNKHDEAEAEFRVCRELRQAVANRYPAIRRYRAELANAHADLGSVLWRLNKRRDCAVEDEAALAGFQRLLAEVPTDLKSRIMCVAHLNRLGEYQLSVSTRASYDKAMTHFRAALKLVDEAAAEARTDREFRRQAAVAQEALGRALASLKQPSEAIPEFRKALTQLDSLVVELPNDPAMRRLRAQARFSLGHSLKDTDRLADAEASFRAALADREEAVQRDPKDFDSRNWMANCHMEFASLHRLRNHADDLIAALRTARDIRKALVADSPTVGYRGQLGLDARNLAGFLAEFNRHSEAEKEYWTAISIFRELVAELPKNRNELLLAEALSRLSHLLINQQRFAEAETLVVEADSIYGRLSGEGLSLEQKKQWAANTGYLASVRAYAGDHEAADQLLAKMMALDSSMLSHVNAACVLGYCVLAAERDTKLTDQQRKDRINQYTDRALGYLRRGVELRDSTPHSRRQLDQYRTDKDLDPFRGHPEFKKILAEIEKLPELAPPPREKKR